jgi:hypothetical protein
MNINTNTNSNSLIKKKIIALNLLKLFLINILLNTQNLYFINSKESVNTMENNTNKPNIKSSVENFIKIRCSLTGENQIFTFRGSVFNYIEQQKPKLLFKVLGFNIARCIKKDNKDWVLLTRELMYYLDPISEEKLSTWKNPYTNETVNVVHVSNDPVNNYMGNIPIEKISSDTGLIIIDVPLFYPNPLYEDPKFKDFSGKNKFYEAGEFFKFYFNLNELAEAEAKNKNKIENVSISWNRDSPYFPWMKMKDINGHLVISAFGAKTENFESFPLWLKMELKMRLKKYMDAPMEFIEPNETSFTYFKQNFESYINWEQFPLEDKKFKKENKKDKENFFLKILE